MLYLCFETFYFYFYSDLRHLIFEKNCHKPRNIKSLALLLETFFHRVWKGIQGIRDFTKKTVQDSGFDCSREAGFTKIGHRMRDNDLKRKWDARFSLKK